jgi:hypothetical protein
MNVFQKGDIKSVIKGFISEKPRNGRGEISRIAQHLNVSPTLISHVLTGQKTLTTDQGQSILSYLGLAGLEADYFMFLLQLERAGTQDAQKYWKMKLDEIKASSLKLTHRLQSDKKLSEEERAIFYSSPLYMMVRLYTSVGEKGKSALEIAQRFELTTLRCAEVLRFLVSGGFCDERNGRYSMSAQTMHLEKTSPHLLRFQTDWRMRALQRGETLSESELMFTAPVSLSKKDFDLLREETILFIKSFLKTVHASPAEEIACLNIDFFWIKN